MAKGITEAISLCWDAKQGMQFPVKGSWKVWKVRVIISLIIANNVREGLKQNLSWSCEEAGFGHKDWLQVSQSWWLCCPQVEGPVGRGGLLLQCKPRKNKDNNNKKRMKLGLSSCNKPRCSEVWARRVITHEFSNKPNVNWVMAEENNFHLLNCKLGLFSSSDLKCEVDAWLFILFF